MKRRWVGVSLALAALVGFTTTAQAGAVRFRGEQIDRASTAVAHAVAAGGSGAADGVTSAGKATGQGVTAGANATKRGTVSVAKGIEAMHKAAVQKTASVAHGIWKAIG